MTMIHVSAVKQPKTNAAGQKSKTGTITDDVAGKNYRIYEDKIPPFLGLEGQTVDVNIDETQEWVRNMGSHGLITGSPRGAGGRPPVTAPTLPPRQSAPGGPVGMQPDRRQAELEKFFSMYITGSVGRHLGGGSKAVSEHAVMATEAIRVFEQVVGPAFLRLGELLNAPKLPKIPTGTNNQWTSEPPADEPGDPGAQLQ